MVCLSDSPFIFIILDRLFSQGCPWTLQTPQNSPLIEKTVRSAHKAVKSTLVRKQNTTAQKKKKNFFLKYCDCPVRRPNL